MSTGGWVQRDVSPCILKYEPEGLPPRCERVEEGVHAGLAADEAHGGGVATAQLLLQVGHEAAHDSILKKLVAFLL